MSYFSIIEYFDMFWYAPCFNFQLLFSVPNSSSSIFSLLFWGFCPIQLFLYSSLQQFCDIWWIEKREKRCIAPYQFDNKIMIFVSVCWNEWSAFVIGKNLCPCIRTSKQWQLKSSFIWKTTIAFVSDVITISYFIFIFMQMIDSSSYKNSSFQCFESSIFW